MRQYHRDARTNIPCIVLSTASPYKFCRSVLAALTTAASEADGVTRSDSCTCPPPSASVPEDEFQAMKALHAKTGIPVPVNLADLESKPVRFTKTIEISEGLQTIAAKMEALST